MTSKHRFSQKLISIIVIICISASFLFGVAQFNIVRSETSTSTLKAALIILMKNLLGFKGQSKEDILKALEEAGIDPDLRAEILRQLGFDEPSDGGGGAGSGSEISNIQDLIQTFNLPPAQEASAVEQKNKLTSSDDANWATGALLTAEKECGSSCLRYLTTAWVWSEGAAAWPDPYGINCAQSGSKSKVSVVCKSNNFQIAGYQAAARASQNDYHKFFEQVYTPDKLNEVLQGVLDNSKRASKSDWNYTSAGMIDSSLFKDNGLTKDLTGEKLVVPESVTMDDIATTASFSPSSGTDFWNDKKQLYTLILGKDPRMVIRLNSVAVSQSDLVNRCLKLIAAENYPANGECYGDSGYYSKAWAQELSNKMAALWLYETGKSDLTPVEGGGGSSSPPPNADLLEKVAYWAEQISPKIEKGSGCSNWYCRLVVKVKNEENGQESTYREGKTANTDAAGRYHCTTFEVDSCKLATGSNCNLSEGAAIMAGQFEDRYTYLDYFRGNHQSNLTNLRRGCYMFQETVHRQQSGHQHASTVVRVQIDSNGNGEISTLDSVAPKKGYTFPVQNWIIKNGFYPLISFGCVK